MLLRSFRMLAFIAMASFVTISCQSNEEPLEVKPQAQEPQLPAEINIISAEEMPIETYSVKTKATTANITAYNVEGTYRGKLYDVNMNNKPKNDVEKIEIDITAQSNNSMRFYLRPFRVGKMPGTLSVDIDNLPLNTDGTFHADEQNNQSLLKKKLMIRVFGIPWTYDVTLIDGSFTSVTGGYKLKMTLESKGSIIGIEIFKAHVKYDGNQL